MEDQEQDQTNQASHGSESSERNEPVRSRWTPKPEQILILESIFNSGMVNPPKDETVRIRKLLEKFGSVGDANVFYWFQNRRSRSRRRQRQIQASLSGEVQVQTRTAGATATAIPYETSCCAGFSNSMSFLPLSASASSASCLGGSSSACGIINNDCANDLFAISGQIGQPEIAQTSSSINPRSHYQSGLISVFINGVATELPRGPFDLRATFGQDFLLFHSSGVPVSVSEYGFLLESLQHGESYFLVSKNEFQNFETDFTKKSITFNGIFWGSKKNSICTDGFFCTINFKREYKIKLCFLPSYLPSYRVSSFSFTLIVLFYTNIASINV